MLTVTSSIITVTKSCCIWRISEAYYLTVKREMGSRLGHIFKAVGSSHVLTDQLAVDAWNMCQVQFQGISGSAGEHTL